MKNQRIIRKKSVDIYNEWLVKRKELLKMTIDERLDLYKSFSWLFPKSNRLITLEEELKDFKSKRRNEKFKNAFLIISDMVLFGRHGHSKGETNYDYFNKAIGVSGKDYTYPKKVILSLGIMDYLISVKGNYSVGHHGNQFLVNISKLNGWDNDDYSFIEITRKCEMDKEWRMDKQFESLSSLSCDEQLVNDATLFCKNFENTDTNKSQEEIQKYRINSDFLSICLRDTDEMTKHTIDDYSGRCHTIWTRQPKEVRKKFLMDSERMVEIDISSAQPTFLGLMLLNKDKEALKNSEWLKHCLTGNFYEWLMGVVGCSVSRKTFKLLVMKYLYSTILVKSDKKYESATYIVSQKIDQYLKTNEPLIYEMIYHSKLDGKREKKGKKKSKLPQMLQREEVRYVKQCAKELPTNIKFLSIHDSFTCKEGDAGVVLAVMKRVSRRLYGVEIKVKIE